MMIENPISSFQTQEADEIAFGNRADQTTAGSFFLSNFSTGSLSSVSEKMITSPDIDEWIAKLKECQLLSESNVRVLCEKVQAWLCNLAKWNPQN